MGPLFSALVSSNFLRFSTSLSQISFSLLSLGFCVSWNSLNCCMVAMMVRNSATMSSTPATSSNVSV